MTRNTLMAAVLLAAVALILPLNAATIEFIGGDGLTDGKYQIGPYEILIDGKPYTAICYDFSHTVSYGQQWEANLLTLDEWDQAYYGTDPDAESKYGSAVWLASLLMELTKTSYRIGAQHAAWMLFSTIDFSDANRWLTSAAEAYANGLPGIDLSAVRIVNSPAGDTPVQGFIVLGYVEAPEPNYALGVGGLLLAGGCLLRGRKPSR